jgi:hypothetical protein
VKRKKCSRCNKRKTLDRFAKKATGRDGLSARCKDCQRVYWDQYYQDRENKQRHITRTTASNQARRVRLRVMVQGLKAVPCTDCGRKYPYYVMQFDHLPGTLKIAEVAYLARTGVGEDKLRKEMAKCEVVCANCHCIRTHKRRTGKPLGRSRALQA